MQGYRKIDGETLGFEFYWPRFLMLIGGNGYKPGAVHVTSADAAGKGDVWD